jgi:hypothetical protein
VQKVRMRSSTSAKMEGRTSAVRCCHILEVEVGGVVVEAACELSGMVWSTVGFSSCCVCNDSVLEVIFSDEDVLMLLRLMLRTDNRS